MADFVAVLRDGDTAGTVATVARATARLLGSGVTTMDVVGLPPDRVADAVLERLAADDVAGAVLSSVQDGSTLWAVLTAATKPVVVVPPRARCATGDIRRVLLPMDGASDTADAVAGIARRLAEGTTVVAVHVLDPATVPAFWDQSAHAGEAWLHEFAARNLPPGARLHVRRGHPAAEVLDDAECCAADLLVLGWKQHVEDGRARLVRSALAGSVPVLLVAAASGPPDGPGGTLGPDAAAREERRVKR